jgi:LPS sulfotransferase NodH
MYSHHKLDHEFERVETTASFAVCALPRSGSSLLCELLFATGLAGAPAEYFDETLMTRFRRRWGVSSSDEYLEALIARKTSPNGVFGFKAHFFQLAQAFPADELERAFPSLRYVYIRRLDRLRQAISWARAIQSGKWASDHEVAERDGISYRRPQVDRLLEGIAERERLWEARFAAAGVDPLRVTYEQLVAAPAQTVRAVLRHIGVEAADSVDVPPPSLRRQADEVTEEWVARYLEGEQAAASRW